jgi:hypothetical protein
MLGSYSAIHIGIFFSVAGALSLVVNKTKYLKDKNWVSFEILFYTMFWILHFLAAFAWLCGDSVDLISGVSGLFSIKILSKVVLLSALGGLAFTLAFLIFCRPDARYHLKMPNDIGSVLSKKEQLHQLHNIQTYALLISFGALLAMIVTAGADFFRSAYSGSAESYAARIAEMVFLPFFRIGFIVCIICALMDQITVSRIVALLYYVCVMVFMLFLGDRGGFALVCVSGGVLLGTLRYNIRLWQFITVLLLFGAVFSFIGEARQSEERTLSSIIKQGIEMSASKDDSKPIFGAMQEYSQSALPAMLMAAEEVPEQTPYFYGYFSMRGLLGIVPFSSKLFPFLSDELRYSSSAEYITWLFFGNSPFRRSGMGTTIIIEPYLDGGVVGVFFALFIVGALGGVYYRHTKYRSMSIDDIVLYAVYTSSFVIAVRSGVLVTLVRGVLWTICVYHLLKSFDRSLRQSKQ